MVRRMCGVRLVERIGSEVLRGRLGIESVLDIIGRGRLRWFGHVERKEETEWVSACRRLKVDGSGGKGRPKKTWSECVNKDLKDLKLKSEWAKDHIIWRRCVHGDVLTYAEHGKRMLNR